MTYMTNCGLVLCNYRSKCDILSDYHTFNYNNNNNNNNNLYSCSKYTNSNYNSLHITIHSHT